MFTPNEGQQLFIEAQRYETGDGVEKDMDKAFSYYCKSAENDDEVGINNTVTVQFVDEGTEETYKIVTTVRGNSLEGLISNESPMGKALLGKKVGETAHVQVNENVGYDVKIVKLENTVDDGSDKLRSF